jgi:selenocysteine-specific elongation factor
MSHEANQLSGLVIGTAGHIDHGKTSLVSRLTGIDTDRLSEEKRRGISIDLGFAHFTLPNGKVVSFVDVPGHERFIRNMLAGVGGIRAVLLVVAANESVMPQTREHLAICRSLGIETGLVVLTKIDLADAGQIEEACTEVRELCAGSFLEACPIVRVDSVHGTGFDQLRQELQRLTDQLRPLSTDGTTRLWVDRSFAQKGFGTIVTGTLLGGSLRPGELVELHPGGKRPRIRGLQVHNTAVEVAKAGQRVAVNLSGVDASEVKRGDCFTSPFDFNSTRILDVQLEWLEADKERPTRQEILFHTGTAEIPGELKLLRASGEPDAAFGRLCLQRPVLVFPEDRAILRQPSPASTIAGARILDTKPRVRLNRKKSLERLGALAVGDDRTRLHSTIGETGVGQTVSEVMRSTGWTRDHVLALAETFELLAFDKSTDRLLNKQWLEQRRAAVLDFLHKFHAEHPSAAGASVSSVRLGLPVDIAGIVFSGIPQLRFGGETVSLESFRPQWSEADRKALQAIEAAYRQSGFQPPTTADLLKQIHQNPQKARSLLESLVKGQTLIRISSDLIFHADVITHIRRSLAQHKGRRFSVPEFKSWTQISRKYAIPLLEYLDHEHVTRRDGDVRIVL